MLAGVEIYVYLCGILHMRAMVTRLQKKKRNVCDREAYRIRRH